MISPDDVPSIPAEAAEASGRPPTPAEVTGAAPQPAGEERPSNGERNSADGPSDPPAEPSAAPHSGEQAPDPAPAPPPRPFLRALGYGIVHLLAMGSVLFVLVGLAPRVEDICERMRFDDRSALTNFVFDLGYHLRKSWYLVPLLLLFDLGVLLILRRSFDPNLARNYTTLVVALALLASILFGYGLLDPLTALYKRQL